MLESKNRGRIDEIKQNRIDFVLMMVKLNFGLDLVALNDEDGGLWWLMEIEGGYGG
jgi:hypothetical protein